jgi:hypothetical protein
VERLSPTARPLQFVGLETLDSGSPSDVDERLAFPVIKSARRNVKFRNETLDSLAGEHPATSTISKNCRVGKCQVHLRESWPDSHKRGSVLGDQVSAMKVRLRVREIRHERIGLHVHFSIRREPVIAVPENFTLVDQHKSMSGGVRVHP